MECPDRTEYVNPLIPFSGRSDDGEASIVAKRARHGHRAVVHCWRSAQVMSWWRGELNADTCRTDFPHCSIGTDEANGDDHAILHLIDRYIANRLVAVPNLFIVDYVFLTLDLLRDVYVHGLCIKRSANRRRSVRGRFRAICRGSDRSLLRDCT